MKNLYVGLALIGSAFVLGFGITILLAALYLWLSKEEEPESETRSWEA
jgi:hypothetical protein